MSSLFFEIVVHLAACGLFGVALGEWAIPAFFAEPAFFPGVIVRVLWAAIMCCIISPIPVTTAASIVLTVLTIVVVPLLSEVVVDEWHAFKHRSDPEPPIAEMDDEISWEYVARLKSSNNGYDSEQFYPVTLVDFSERDDPFWPYASVVYMVEIRRRCQVWRTITIWQVSILNGGQKKIHTFHDFCRWTDATWFGRRFEIPEHSVNCFQTNGVVFAAFYYCDEINVYIHDIRYGKSSVVTILDRDFFRPLSTCCLGRLVNDDGAIEGWRVRWVAGYSDIKDGQSACARITQKVLDLRGHTICRSHEELVFGNFEDDLNLSPVRTSRGHFGLGALEENTGVWIVVLYDPVTGKYDRCMNEEELAQLDRPYNAVTMSGQFVRRPMVLTDRECITGFSHLRDGTVLRAQFAAPTLKYRTAKALFRSSPGLRDRMNAEQFRQVSGIDGMGGHFR